MPTISRTIVAVFALSAAVPAVFPALLPLAAPARAAEPGASDPLPFDPAVLAQARAVKSLPCAGGGRPGGFAPDEGAPAAWRVAKALVSVRRKQGDRLAFVLAQPEAGSGPGPGAADASGRADCAVRDVVVLPRGGSLLTCALQDNSVQGIGVHTVLPSGRRDLLFWRVDAAGALRRQGTGPDDDDFESDTGELICALPDPPQ